MSAVRFTTGTERNTKMFQMNEYISLVNTVIENVELVTTL